jgi:hypothetical protein
MVVHNYLGNYPDEIQAEWTSECQGVCHDRTHWFITQESAVWRVPVIKDLDCRLRPGVSGVSRAGIPIQGYDHFGDPDWRDGLLFIPLEGKRRIGWFEFDRAPRIAIFNSVDLRLLGSSELPQKKSGWCAIDSSGRLYSSNSDVSPSPSDSKAGPLFRYQVNGTSVELIDRVVLRDEQGDPLSLDTVQGGTFADDDHLYLSCGYFEDPDPSWGLHLFDLRSGRRIARSTNGGEPWNYQFLSGGDYDEEPEGLTWWDLDRSDAPGIEGQLHAIVLDNDDNGDDIYFKHYRVEGLLRPFDPRRVVDEPDVVIDG